MLFLIGLAFINFAGCTPQQFLYTGDVLTVEDYDYDHYYLNYDVDKNFWVDVLPQGFVLMGHFSEGLAVAAPAKMGSSNERAAVTRTFGYADRIGKLAIPYFYSQCGAFKDGAAVVAIKGEFETYSGIIDRSGKRLFWSNDSWVSRKRTRAGHFLVKKNESDESLLLDTRAKLIRHFSREEGWANLSVNRDGYLTAYDMQRKCAAIIDPRSGQAIIHADEVVALLKSFESSVESVLFDEISNGVLVVNLYRDDGSDISSAAIDLKAKSVLFPPVEFQLFAFRGERFRFRIGDEWGFLDRKGNRMQWGAFSKCGDFYDGLARIESDQGWGYINQQGKIVVPTQYSYVENFEQGYGKVFTDTNQDAPTYGFVNTSGQLIIPCIFFEAPYF